MQFYMQIAAIFIFLFLCSAPRADLTNDNPAISVSVSVPLNHGNRSIDVHNEDSHIHVIITNHSKTNINLWREWSSWGYFNLSFELTEDNGKKTIIEKKDRSWTKNFPDFVTLDADESLIINVSLHSNIWNNLPPSGSLPKKASIRAIYNSKSSDSTKKHGVWAGRITSKFQVYTLH